MKPVHENRRAPGISGGFGIFLILTIVISVCGCGSSDSGSAVVAEGVIFSVEYQLENGQTGGFTRVNSSGAVPGGNGSWNIDAYGKLTRDFLIINLKGRKDLGPRIIPASRLVDIQFGTGSIEIDGGGQSDGTHGPSSPEH